MMVKETTWKERETWSLAGDGGDDDDRTRYDARGEKEVLRSLECWSCVVVEERGRGMVVEREVVYMHEGSTSLCDGTSSIDSLYSVWKVRSPFKHNERNSPTTHWFARRTSSTQFKGCCVLPSQSRRSNRELQRYTRYTYFHLSCFCLDSTLSTDMHTRYHILG